MGGWVDGWIYGWMDGWVDNREVGVVVRPAHRQVVPLVTLTARVAAGVETACTGGEREREGGMYATVVARVMLSCRDIIQR